ncbi:MAG: SDR family NAD(P)-dependent oxidoreductase [Treponema sp.]|nr:SDR family NAD(P)-dependent oxidoreductase [Treponema sp.]
MTKTDSFVKLTQMKAKNTFQESYGPWALVAGGSEGLGEAFAQALAKRGLNLVLLARREDKLRQAAEKLKERYSIDVNTHALDLADFEKTKQIICGLKEQLGIMVYNAAFAPIGLFENIPEEQLALAADVNVKGPLLLSKLMSERMMPRGKGGIVLMSSLAGTQGSLGLQTYSATKSFNAILAEGLWKELKPHGIDVIACVAGAILTPGYRQAEKNKPAPGTLSAETVAEKTLQALGKKPVIVPGAVNKIARFLMLRILSRKAAISLMMKNTGGLS